jgi:hypothetical protein
MPFSFWRPGMVMTEERLNDASMVGAVVFLANRGTSQSIPSGSDTAAQAIQWDTVDMDILGGWSAAQPTRWTAPRSGWWLLAGAVGFDRSTGGNTRECVWYVGGGAISMGRARTFGGTMADVPVTVEARTVPRLLTAGQYVELVPAHNAGAALTTATGSYRPYMAITYVGPA